MSYRGHFVGEGAAAAYDTEEYAGQSYGSLLWAIESGQLDALLRDVSRDARYLDFACGTGRVLAHVAPYFASATGIEIAPSMAELARRRVPDAKILVRDITSSDVEVEGTYDVVTAFRFMLNAEPELRVAALRALRRRLAGPEAILIFNNHGNLFSHKLVTAAPRMLRHRGTHQPSGNVLTEHELRRVAREARLEIRRVAGAGLLGGRLAQRLPRTPVERLERRFAASSLSRLGSNQIYVARTTV